MLHFSGVRPSASHKPSFFHETLINNFFFLIQINASRKPCFPAFHRKKSRGNFRLRYSTLRLFVPLTMKKFFTKFCTNRSVIYKMTSSWTQSRAHGLSWFGSRARFHALRCTSSDLHSTNKKKNMYSNSSRHIKISRKHQIFICHVTIQAHNRPLRKPEFWIEASNSARKQTQYIQNNKKI